MTARPLSEIVHSSWLTALTPVEPVVAELGTMLREEIAVGRGYLPAGENVLRAFADPMDAVRVLVVGQDPYPTPGHPIGLAFAVAADVWPLPPSLRNIYAELERDLGIAPATHGDLSAWADQGVMLLNRCLSVRPGAVGSHRGHGWEQVTSRVISALAARGGPCVAILWGKDAQSVKPLLGPIQSIESAHPSPLSARRGFIGSRPFSRANALLVAQSAEPIDWELPDRVGI